MSKLSPQQAFEHVKALWPNVVRLMSNPQVAIEDSSKHILLIGIAVDWGNLAEWPPGEFGPIYGVKLIDSLPLNNGMLQAMPSRDDLEQARKGYERVVAGYEVLLQHYHDLLAARKNELRS